MITLISSSKQFGNTKQYIARITGRAPKFTFAREFVGRKNGSTTEALIDDAGLYEEGDYNRKGRKELSYRVVLPRPVECPPLAESSDPEWLTLRVTESEAMQIAKRMDAGETLEAMIAVERQSDSYVASVRTPSKARKADAALSANKAAEQCWAVLQAFPPKEALAVLKALKLRVQPPPGPVLDPLNVNPDPSLR